ncbi:hypothetical protein NDU88_003664 [Pleurodeles waltl]|uniref:Uncharacterized protein n=1 Tax=Pleurodeles waltl TaxID=8319 RepID=A0AAV7RGI7_PLEWA|nr:hypothetical protein NDU88_003664 [Pleurodeles waltl]
MPPQACGCVTARVTTQSEARESEEEAPKVSAGHWRRVALEKQRSTNTSYSGLTIGDVPELLANNQLDVLNKKGTESQEMTAISQ